MMHTHYYRVDNIEKAASGIPSGEFSILLSHTQKIYRQAAHAGFDLLLVGHTHGGQICLPGSIPITLDSVLPRRMGPVLGSIMR
jgi:predicted MPP superfamily phosphohydrolase